MNRLKRVQINRWLQLREINGKLFHCVLNALAYLWPMTFPPVHCFSSVGFFCDVGCFTISIHNTIHIMKQDLHMFDHTQPEKNEIIISCTTHCCEFRSFSPTPSTRHPFEPSLTSSPFLLFLYNCSSVLADAHKCHDDGHGWWERRGGLNIICSNLHDFNSIHHLNIIHIEIKWTIAFDDIFFCLWLELKKLI